MKWPNWIARLVQDQDGVSAIEFALLAPLFLFILSAAMDFGALVHTRSQLESALSSATSYALAKGQDAKAGDAAELARSTAQYLSSLAGSDTTATVLLNNGSTATVSNGHLSQSGNATNMGACYCPARRGHDVSWGSAMSCGTSCSAGGTAGKFAFLTVAVTYRALFHDYGLAENETIHLTTLMRIQ